MGCETRGGGRVSAIGGVIFQSLPQPLSLKRSHILSPSYALERLSLKRSRSSVCQTLSKFCLSHSLSLARSLVLRVCPRLSDSYAWCSTLRFVARVATLCLVRTLAPHSTAGHDGGATLVVRLPIPHRPRWKTDVPNQRSLLLGKTKGKTEGTIRPSKGRGVRRKRSRWTSRS